MMRAFLMVGLFGTSMLVGCGSDGNEGPGTGNGGAPGTGSAPSTGGGSNAGAGGGGGNTTAPGANEYPDGEAVNHCFGTCPNGECDDKGVFADTPCSTVYPAPLDENSSYCGAREGSYCLNVGGTIPGIGDLYGVQCVGGKATVRFCPSHCSTDSSVTSLECR